MVQTFEILPHASLQHLIRCYSYRTFDTGDRELLKPIHAMHEFFMTFWLGGGNFPILKLNEGEGTLDISGSDKQILGLQSTYRGTVAFKGGYRLFSIQFRPNGFFRVFGIPMQELTHKMLNSEDVLGRKATVLIDQLNEARSVEKMVECTELFLLSYLMKGKAKDPYERITRISNILRTVNPDLHIPDLAYQANMSLRAFEYQFANQVGLSPKLYIRISRFNSALLQKMIKPERSWTDIALSTGYYDQNHFIKDFRTFSSKTPNEFMKFMPPPMEHFNQIIE